MIKFIEPLREMVMDIQHVVNFLLTTLVLVLGGIMRSFQNRVEKLADSLNQHVVDSAKTYAPITLIAELRKEIKQDMQEIKDMTIRIEDKLDRKADK